MNIDQIRRDTDSYRKANPWYIQNLQNPQALCGRFPTREAAENAAKSYASGVVAVQGFAVQVSEMPCL